MPTYEFICDNCNTNWEDILTLAEYQRTVRGKCPACQKRAIRQRMYPQVLKTSTEWLKGRKMLGDQFPDNPSGRQQLAYRIAQAQAAGYKPSASDYYDPTVAAYPGDPDGFIPQADPAGHVTRVCAKRGVGCDSSLVKVASPMSGRSKPAPLADDIVRDLASEKIRANPDLGQKSKAEVAEMIRGEHSYAG